MDPAIGTGIAVVVVLVIVVALLLRGRLRGEPRHIDADFEQQLRAREPHLDPSTAPRADRGVEPPQPGDLDGGDQAVESVEPTAAAATAGTGVWLITGVNGTGKTTSIGKLAARHTRAGEHLVLAAADTFRAAAAEQLELWGERAGARVVRHGQGADPGAGALTPQLQLL